MFRRGGSRVQVVDDTLFKIKISHSADFVGMVMSLKEQLETQLSDIAVETQLIHSEIGAKVYKIVIGDRVYFEWCSSPRCKQQIKVAPSSLWKTPINFETHADVFGPGIGVQCSVCRGTRQRGILGPQGFGLCQRKCRHCFEESGLLKQMMLNELVEAIAVMNGARCMREQNQSAAKPPGWRSSAAKQANFADPLFMLKLARMSNGRIV